MIPRDTILATSRIREPDWEEETLEIDLGFAGKVVLEIFVREIPDGFQLVQREREEEGPE